MEADPCVVAHFYVPNNRHSELLLEYAAEHDEASFFLLTCFPHDKQPPTPYSARYRVTLAALPTLPDAVDLEGLKDALQQRAEAHPLANRLPGTTALIQRGLERGLPPLEVAKHAIAALSVEGTHRALAQAAEGPDLTVNQRSELARLARAACLMQDVARPRHLRFDEAEPAGCPVFPEGKHPQHDTAAADVFDRLYDTRYREFFDALRGYVQATLEGSNDALEAWTPRVGWSAERVLERAERAGEDVERAVSEANETILPLGSRMSVMEPRHPTPEALSPFAEELVSRYGLGEAIVDALLPDAPPDRRLRWCMEAAAVATSRWEIPPAPSRRILGVLAHAAEPDGPFRSYVEAVESALIERVRMLRHHQVADAAAAKREAEREVARKKQQKERRRTWLLYGVGVLAFAVVILLLVLR